MCNKPEWRKDTETFKYWNVNPKKYITSDCVARSITMATGNNYEDVVMGIAKIQCEICRCGKEDYETYLERIGWEKQRQPKKSNGKKYTIDEFCKKMAKPNKSYVVSCANHLTCIVDRRIYDTWNCGYKSVGNYWEREEH